MANRTTSSSQATAEHWAADVRLREGAKALVTSSERVLLVEEEHGDGTPFWTLPGGGVHDHESPADGLCRELAEELYCSCRVADPVSEFWYAHDSLDGVVSRYTVYDCSLLSTAVPNREEGILDCRWVAPPDLPTGTLPQVRQLCRSAFEE